jgi:hypothetical protein
VTGNAFGKKMIDPATLQLVKDGFVLIRNALGLAKDAKELLPSLLRQQAHGFALGSHQAHGLSVEGDEGLRTKPPSLVGDNAIREVAA